jgi:hypothetical protein
MKAAFALWSACCLSLSAGTLKFDETTKDLKADADAKTITADFSFKNESSDDVVIKRYDAACTCISAQVQGGKLIYKPGESGIIRAAFDMSQFSGTTDKSVAVWLNDDPDAKPSIILTTRVTIPVLVDVEPKTLIWEIGGKPEPKTVVVTMSHTTPIHVKRISGADGRFTQELKTIEEGKKYEIVVTPAGTDKVGMGVIHIETDCEIARHRSQRIFTVVRQTLPTPAQTVAKP